MDIFVARVALEIKDKKSVEHVVADQLSRLDDNEVTKKKKNIIHKFLDGHLMEINERSWFVNMANYKATKMCLKTTHGNKISIFTKRLIVICGMSHICLRLVLME